MSGKKYLDKRCGTPRGNGYGIVSILEDYAIETVSDAIKRCPKHIVLIKANPSIDGSFDTEIETIEVKYLLAVLNK